MKRRPGTHRGVGHAFRRDCAGVGAVEFLLAMPLVLLLGLGLWQWALVLQSRQLVEFAAWEAARAGSLGHASEASVDAGLALGLSAFWGDLDLGQSRELVLRASESRLGAATRAGWVEWRQLSPTRESFADWGQTVPLAPGDSTAATVLEIPVDNTVWRARMSQPASGSTGQRSGEAVGSASGQTFLDASLLRIEVTVGAPLHVPLAGPFIAWVAKRLNGCAAAPSAGLGAIRLRSDEGILRRSDSPGCAFFEGPDHAGRTLPRLPLRVVAQARMQSGARVSGRTPTRVQRAAGALAPADLGSTGQLAQSAPAGDDPGAPAPRARSLKSDSTEAGESPRPEGFLSIGGERELWSPGACVAPPS